MIALTADSAILTAWSNDMGYDQVFARQVQAYGRPGDVLIGISTSGTSPNIVEAFKQAYSQDMITIALLGKSGGDVFEQADIAILVPSYDTARTQEAHIHILHILCDLVERNLSALRPQEERLFSGLEPKRNGDMLRIARS